MASIKAFILCFTLLLSISQVYGHDDEYQCGHDHTEPEVVDVEEDMSAFDEGRILQSSSYPSLRIYPHYDTLTATASSSYISYVKNQLMPPILAYYSAALKIKAPLTSNLKLGSSVGSICSNSVPSILRTTGVATDHFVFFTSFSTTDGFVAASSVCSSTSSTRRPFISRVSLNRYKLVDARGNVLLHEKNMYVIMHEMMHSLGFSQSSFPRYIDSSGRTRTGHIKSVSIGGVTRKVVDVPPLTEKLRNFYGCSTLPGAVIENEGGSGTAGTHFERKFFPYETMSSGGIHGRRVSEFSLAMLEGSGWYVPDYKYAEPYYYGQGEGCSFISGKCSTTSAQFDEYCTGSSRGCAPQGRSGGYCSSDPLTDGCRWVKPDEDYDCENSDGEDYARLPSLQVFGRGAGSRCFTGDLNTRISSNGRTTFCFKYTCTGSGSDTRLEVQVGNNKVVCTKKEKRFIDGYYGGIDCPDPLAFCNTAGKKFCPRNCMGRGTCVDNKCQCYSGFMGSDCALKA